ncbi:NACHT domain-containing protein [Actinoplanes sp. NPDC051346]|uniref:NACHT domain-containing protein n=1 Tax=Actinoplanes sp. NPDC051346 TaxID=3155048 RepID=UPI003449AECD
MTDPITTVVGAVLRMGAEPAKTRAMRDARVVKLLKAVGLAGDAAPPDFESVYARTIVEYCAFKPAPVVRLFADVWVRKAFRRSFEHGDWDRVRTELSETIDRNRETGDHGLRDRDAAELDGFVEEFQRQVRRTRRPAEVAAEQKIDLILARMDDIRGAENAYREQLEPARRAMTTLEKLAADIDEWLDAVGYRVAERLGDTWVVRAPITPGRPGRLAIMAVDTELTPAQVERAMALKQQVRAEGAWIVAPRRISPAARSCAARDASVLCLTFDDLVDLAVDFEPYVDWLDAEVERRGLVGRYVRLSCTRDDSAEGVENGVSIYDWRAGGLDEYARRWLDDPAKEHLSVIGAFGSGKSWFSLHFAWEQAQLWRESRDRGLLRARIPLLVPLRDYAKAVDVEAVISKFLFDRDLRLGTRVFRYLNRTGRLLLIFDGFDEMAARVDRQTMVENFWELATVVEPGAKVLLSSRTEHFPTAELTRRLLSGELHAAVAAPGGETPRFDVAEISMLDDEQIDRVLRGRTNDTHVIETIMWDPNLRDLLRRPVMADLVLTALPEIRAGEAVDLAHIYLYAIRHKLDQDIRAERTFTSRADKLYFLCELAWEMVRTSTLEINFREIPDRLRAYFGPAIAGERELDHWEHDMRTQTLLIRNAAGDYTPAHRSFVEWLVAYTFAGELGILDGPYLDLLGPVDPDGVEATWSAYFTARGPGGSLPALSRLVPESVGRLRERFGDRPLDPAVVEFLRAMAESGPDGSAALERVARSTRGLAEAESGQVGSNCLRVLADTGRAVEVAGAALHGLRRHEVSSLDGADLRGVEVPPRGLEGVSLRGADLRGAWLDDSVLRVDLPLDVTVTPAGAIAATSLRELIAWPDGDLTGEPRPLVSRSGVLLTKTRLLHPLAGSTVYSGIAGPGMVDLSTGETTSVSAMHWTVAIEWQGVPAILTEGVELDFFAVRSRSDLHVMGWVPYPDHDDRRPWAGITYAEGGGIRRVRHVGHSLFVDAFDEQGGWRLAGAWVLAPGHQVRVERGFVWVRPDSGPPVLMDLAGEPCWSPDAAEEFPSGALPFLVSAVLDTVVVAQDGELAGWPMPAGKPRWRVPVPLGVHRLAAHPDGATFLYVAESGEVGRRRIDDGSLVARRLLTDRFQGARFSRDAGLSAAALDVLALGGAEIS